MKKNILLCSMALLICTTGCVDIFFTRMDNEESVKKTPINDEVYDEIDDVTTTTTTTTTKKTTTTTTTTTTTKKTDSRIKEGTYTSKFGESNSAEITINYDGTAYYNGNIDNNTSKKRKTNGTWNIKTETVIEVGEKSEATFIKFEWEDGTKEDFFLYSNSFFGDQWHEFKLIN